MPRSMRIADVSDREVVALAQDVAHGNGGFTTADLAVRFGYDLESDHHPLGHVGVRLGYLRKLGMFERDETGLWYLTPLGGRFARGGLTATQRKALESLKDEGAAWAATESLARLLGGAGDTQAAMMRRQWQHGWAQRNYR